MNGRALGKSIGSLLLFVVLGIIVTRFFPQLVYWTLGLVGVATFATIMFVNTSKKINS